MSDINSKDISEKNNEFANSNLNLSNPRARKKFNRNQKLILMTSLGLLSLFMLIGFLLNFKNFSKNSNKVASASTSKRAPTVGYIIEYKKDSLSKTLKKGASKSEIEKQINELNSSNNDAEKDILQKLGRNSFNSEKTDKESVKVKGNYKYAINGIALDISEDEAERLKSSPYVKAVYPDLEVKTNLNTSVPLIGVDQVLSQVKDSLNLPVKGKGINVAVLDTGVDYSHLDLGGTPIQERQLTKINTKSRYGTSQFYDTNNTKNDYSDDRIVYDLNDSTVSIYTFSNGANTEYNVIPSDLTKYWVSGPKVFGNKLIYILSKSESASEDAGLYLMNLDTKEISRITTLMNASKAATLSSKYYLYGNKVIFPKLTENTTLTHGIFVKDLNTGEELKITTDQTYPQQPVYFGNKMIYTEVTGGKVTNQVVYNIDNGEKTSFLPPEANTISDFDGQKILYVAISNSDYMLYDLATGATSRIKVTDSVGTNKYAPQYLKTTGAGVYGGLIGDGVIFFQRNRSSGAIMANDQVSNRFAQMNLINPAIDIKGVGKRVCFQSSINWDIYCHDYDSSYSYPVSPNINSKVVGGYNFILNNDYYIDDNSHGTHVAGIIGANGSLKGVATEANIVSYKVLDLAGIGYNSGIISAIDQSIATRFDSDSTNDISVINMSLGADCGGYYNSGCGPDDILSKSVDNASSQGISVVVGAGNSGPGASTITSPGTARSAITVGAVDNAKLIADFSSRGPVNITNESIVKPDILAPGVNICSAQLFGSFYSSYKCIDTTHIKFSGTSMAAPHVAGTVALIKQLHPDWSPQQIKDAIKNNADNLNYDVNTQGAGLINALKIFSIARQTPTPTPTITPIPKDTTPPTVAITSPLNNSTVTKNTTVTISSTASDSVGMRGVDFFVAGKLLCSDTTAPYTCAWKVPAKTGVSYTITARAVDTSMNTASASITVRSK